MEQLSDTQVNKLRILKEKGKFTRTLDEDGYEYTCEDWEGNEEFLYPQTFQVLNKNGFIEKYLSPTPYCDFFCISTKGLIYLDSIEK